MFCSGRGALQKFRRPIRWSRAVLCAAGSEEARRCPALSHARLSPLGVIPVISSARVAICQLKKPRAEHPIRHVQRYGENEHLQPREPQKPSVELFQMAHGTNRSYAFGAANHIQL